MAKEARDYSVTIVESSKKDLTARERIMLKDTSGAQNLNDLVHDEQGIVITPIAYAVLDIHNSKATGGDADYRQYLVLDDNGDRYITGSDSFFEAFSDIWGEMADEDGQPSEVYSIRVYSLPSKNFAGRFLTCSIM